MRITGYDGEQAERRVVGGTVVGPTPVVTASIVSVADVGGNFAGTDVEAVLAELAALSNADTSLVTVAATGATETVDVSVARTYDLTLTANCTLTLTGAVNAEAWYVSLLLRQDGTGSRTMTWPGSVVWPGGVTPTLSTAAASVDVFTLFTLDGGTVWFGFPTGGGGGTAATTVEAETTFGLSSAVGTDTEYARQDHTHGSPSLATLETSGHWEVLMDGGSPYEPLDNGSGTDWLWVWVPG